MSDVLPSSSKTAAWIVFLSLLAIYHANVQFLPINDARVNALLCDSLIQEGNLTFSRTEVPEMFEWNLHVAKGTTPVTVLALDQTLRDMIAHGEIRPNPNDHKFRDVVAPTTDPDLFANTFCPGTAFAALPVLAVVSHFVGGFAEHPCPMWRAGKFVSSACVAGSAALIYLIAARWLSHQRALLVAYAYGLGTCVWSISSQTLWQHGPNELFLALAAFALVRPRPPGWGDVALAGLAVSAATWCRPTGAFLAVILAIHLFLHHRSKLPVYVLIGLPFASLLLLYNHQMFGSPFVFGQTRITNVAVMKTGSPKIWQTAVWEGAAGLLVSPSRGLFVYSPFLLFAVWGAIRVHREEAWNILRPFLFSILAVWFVEFQHFDWWGGWSYGYRHIVDTIPFAMLMLIPVMDPILDGRWLRKLWKLALAWSIFVQVLGAFAGDFQGWNGKEEYEVDLGNGGPRVVVEDLKDIGFPDVSPSTRIEILHRNIDLPFNRDRLWSIEDSQLRHHCRQWIRSIVIRWRDAEKACGAYLPELSATYASLAASYQELGMGKEAEAFAEQALRISDSNPRAHRVKAEIARSKGEHEKAMAELRLARELSPLDSDLNHDLGKALLENGKLDEAETYLNHSLRFNAKRADAKERLEEVRRKRAGGASHGK